MRTFLQEKIDHNQHFSDVKQLDKILVRNTNCVEGSVHKIS